MEESLEQLVRRAVERDADAFAGLIRRFERTALALALAGTGEPHAAGDVVQDAFVRAWQRLSTLNDPGRFGPWLAGIVRNLAADYRRTGQRGRQREDLESAQMRLASYDDPAAHLHRNETRGLIAQAIESLDEVSRSIVVLRYFEQLTSRQIAALLDLSPAAVDMRLMRARQQLRQRLAPHADPEANLNESREEPVANLTHSRVGGVL